MPERADPAAAEAAFYDAFARGDFDAMMSLWAPAVPIVCVHPLGPRLADRETIAESWRQILGNEAPREFTLDLISAWHDKDLAVHMLDEIISVPGSDARFRPVIATNVYRRIDAEWYIVQHHASIDASDPPAVQTAANPTRH